MNRLFKILAFVALAVCPVLALPEAINFQGRLADDAGVPLSGSRTMALTIHDAPAGGSVRYTEDIGEVSLNSGVYSFQFGQSGISRLPGPQGEIQSPGIAAALGAGGELWLELAVDGVPQLPRQRLLAVPYAMLAGSAAAAERLELRKNAFGVEAIEIVRGNGEIQRVTVPGHDGALLPSDGTGVEAAAFRKAIGLPPATTIHVGDHGAVGNGIADDTSAIQAAFAKARTTLQPVVFEPGKRYRVSAGFDLDWVDVRLIGHGSAVACASDGFNLFTLGKAGGPTQRILIDGLTLFGTSTGSQVGIDCLDHTPKMITLRDCQIRNFGGSGLYTRHTDYLLIEKCFFKGNRESNWTGGPRTNVSTVLSSAFNGQDDNGQSVTRKHIHAIDIDGLCMIGSEFGDGEYGLYLESSSEGHNTGITMRNCRTERVRVRDAVLGTALGMPIPSNIAFEECTFMGDGITPRTEMMTVQGCERLRFRQCSGIQMPANSVMVKSLTRMNTSILIEDCYVGGSGTHVFRLDGQVPSSARRIVFGGDASFPDTTAHTTHFAIAPQIKATSLIPCGVTPTPIGVRQVTVLIGGDLVSTTKTYWNLELHCFRNGIDQGVIASGNTQGIARWSAFNGLELALGPEVSLQAGDALVMSVAKTGFPAALKNLTVTVAAEPE
ncbi:right-handed parallel beta-helix repeat-containing protein [Luteolibacter marinus]|uniref:right-handed parallel beta-helix repeat-containing protein n=1 Tax=Luteolibacter marinus TaxID=2776705 RepID=UPI0018676E0E|nr:right-handed parallel beta-helix repeat-containing protein [Luteolibacter marinus]